VKRTEKNWRALLGQNSPSWSLFLHRLFSHEPVPHRLVPLRVAPLRAALLVLALATQGVTYPGLCAAQDREIEVEPPKVEKSTTPPVPTTKRKSPKKKKCIIGATATLLEKQSELAFRARVDSGAKSCSLHVQKIKIENESKKENPAERMQENIGKVIHFEVKNGDDKTHILTSKIAGYVIIKTSNMQEGKRRYKVLLTFRWKSMEKEVLVTLNNRSHMEYPLLLGRNFLRGDFLVDVELHSDD